MPTAVSPLASVFASDRPGALEHRTDDRSFRRAFAPADGYSPISPLVYLTPVRRWKEATSCAERYVAKPEGFPAGSRTGRVWGIWGEQLLPVRWETVEVGLWDAFRIRRVYRKLARRKGGSLRRITVFVRYENALRLLGFLGYRLE